MQNAVQLASGLVGWLLLLTATCNCYKNPKVQQDRTEQRLRIAQLPNYKEQIKTP